MSWAGSQVGSASTWYLLTEGPTVAGTAVGELVEVDTLEEAEARVKGPAVVVLRQATGDEDVSSCEGSLRGLILCHSLPHLSHLGALHLSSFASPSHLVDGRCCTPWRKALYTTAGGSLQLSHFLQWILINLIRMSGS